MIKLLQNKKTEDVMNITSLIDVIFILLIFFMVSTQFKKNSLPLDLPKSEDTTQEENNSIVLSVTENAMQLEGKDITLETLTSELSAKYAVNPEISLSVECEKTLQFESLVQILTAIQQSGISRIGIIHETMD